MSEHATLSTGHIPPVAGEGALPGSVAVDDAGTEFAPAADVLPVPVALAHVFASASVMLYEWREYRLLRPGADAVQVGGQPGRHVIGSCFSIRLENRLGLTQIRFLRDGRPLGEDIWAEVVSPKFPDPAAHCAFLRTLLDDLYLRAARLPFEFEAATGRQVTESLRPPSPLFTFHFLHNRGQELQTALQIILAQPHRTLHDERRRVPLGEATDVDADTIHSILAESRDWARAPHLAIADALGGYAPRRVWQRLPLQSYDTPENRFVLEFIRSVQAAAEALPSQPWWGNVSAGRRRRVEEAGHALRHVCLHPMWEEVGRMTGVPASSQVLIRREGYRKVRELWQVFHQARRPLFGPLQTAIDLRDIATLYEFWVFFRLCEEIGDVLGEAPVLRLDLADVYGLGYRSEARFGRQGTLAYNRGFAGGGRSYSVALRPDFTWFVKGVPTVVLDAKFRLSWTQVTQALESEDPEDDTAPELQAEAVRSDLYKMHTYRDALGVRAAVALYPGDVARFYHVDKRPPGAVSLADALFTDLRGIGAIPLKP